jgi:hypothetical protein
MDKTLKRTVGMLGAGVAVSALAWGGYAVIRWSRYGKSTRIAPPDPLLDRYMPAYEVRERHETRVEAPADVTWAAVHDLDLRSSGLVRAIFAGRELLMRARSGAPREPSRDFMEEVLALGWRVLAEEPGREIVVGAVTRPWVSNPEFRGLTPEEFAAFNEPGFAQIAWTLAVEPAGEHGCLFRTETRVRTTDGNARERFRRYWAVVSPGVLLIRQESLRLVRREAARRWRRRAAGSLEAIPGKV